MPMIDEKKTLPMIKFWKTVKLIHCKLLEPQFDKKKIQMATPANSYAIPQKNFVGSQS